MSTSINAQKLLYDLIRKQISINLIEVTAQPRDDVQSIINLKHPHRQTKNDQHRSHWLFIEMNSLTKSFSCNQCMNAVKYPDTNRKDSSKYRMSNRRFQSAEFNHICWWFLLLGGYLGSFCETIYSVPLRSNRYTCDIVITPWGLSCEPKIDYGLINFFL